MRASGLHHRADFSLFAQQDRADMLEGWNKRALNSQCRTHVDGRRNDVIAALTHIDMIVRVHRAPEPASGEARDYLVSVHIGARARASLKDVDWELRIVLPG